MYPASSLYIRVSIYREKSFMFLTFLFSRERNRFLEREALLPAPHSPFKNSL